MKRHIIPVCLTAVLLCSCSRTSNAPDQPSSPSPVEPSATRPVASESSSDSEGGKQGLGDYVSFPASGITSSGATDLYGSVAEVTRMGKWRRLFESNMPPVEQREYGKEYTFGPPATSEEVTAAEQALGVRLPADVREMLSEFNGIWQTSEAARKNGYDPDIAFLDTKHMSVDVPRYLRNSGNTVPPEATLRKVVFVCQSNGFADLWGVCLADVGGFRAGQVVKLDHEVGELEACHPNLAEFVRAGRFSINNK